MTHSVIPYKNGIITKTLLYTGFANNSNLGRENCLHTSEELIFNKKNNNKKKHMKPTKII